MTKLILSHSTNPFYNLAIEDWAVRNLDTTQDDYLFLYKNTDCVVIGRNQNVFQEVNIPFCKKNQIEICRRVSGGGTVFHDTKNLNWTFIRTFENKSINNYTSFASPIIQVLQNNKLDAFLNDRNAIMIGETKISGQAQFTNRKNILSHGTLLVESDTYKLEKSIQPEGIEVKTKASPSVRSTVKNMGDLLRKEVSLEKMQDAIIQECKAFESFDIETEEIQKKILKIQKTYQTKKWIFERSSKCTILREYQNQKVILEIEKAKIISVQNENGNTIENSPLIGTDYIDLF